MLIRVQQFVKFVKSVERSIINSLFGHPPKELALVYTIDVIPSTPQKRYTLEDIVGNGIFLAVPKFRRTIERRWKRKYGSPDYSLKTIVPKSSIKVCQDCGHHHEYNRLCENCYKRIKSETQSIMDKIIEKLGSSPIEKEVIVLYEGENVPDEPKEFWKGKRIIEMKKERPKWFSQNLLQKSTQQPSDSKDIKPTDLA